ncbi:MAG: DNA polymerase Y family protein [Burkholderiaceae bacterium]
MLWIALHLPLLSLETLASTLLANDERIALGLIDGRAILAVNRPAQALGVTPGMKRATALALAPQMALGAVDLQRDAQALQSVAHAALAFTPLVALQPSTDPALPADTVLLEVQASLRYFGGAAALLQRLLDALAPLRHRVHSVAAPTAQAAALLARIHPRLDCADLAASRVALDAAPVWLLGPGREHWEALQGMGLQTLSDLRQLPRAGLARRFGEALLDELDRAHGDRPDPREPLAVAEQFETRLELFARADTTEQVLHGADVLLGRLAAWLAARHAFVRRFTLLMQHEPRWSLLDKSKDDRTPAATELEIALAEPARDPVHLLTLLRERLARLQLAAPTLELRLRADQTVQRAAPNSELFPTARSECEGLVRLIERLQARLGEAQVRRLVALQDHRPERASALRAADLAAGARSGGERAPAAGGSESHAIRPVWLLPAAQALPERHSRPFLDGAALQLVSGPERIEAGWWDGALAERDYFIAQAPDGALVWIYRARLPLSAPQSARGWFMQGRFG